jgi:hypothetical protein
MFVYSCTLQLTAFQATKVQWKLIMSMVVIITCTLFFGFFPIFFHFSCNWFCFTICFTILFVCTCTSTYTWPRYALAIVSKMQIVEYNKRIFHWKTRWNKYVKVQNDRWTCGNYMFYKLINIMRWICIWMLFFHV